MIDLLLIFLITFQITYAGTEKAVIATSKEQGFRLSEIAIKRIGIKTIHATESGRVVIPSSAIVHSLEVHGIYRKRDGWIRLIHFESGEDHSSLKTEIRSSEIKAGDEIVVEATGLLRAAEMEAFGGAE